MGFCLLLLGGLLVVVGTALLVTVFFFPGLIFRMLGFTITVLTPQDAFYIWIAQLAFAATPLLLGLRLCYVPFRSIRQIRSERWPVN